MPDLLHSQDIPIPEESTAGMRHFNPFSKEEVEQSITARFEKQVCLYPEKIAVSDARSTLTYRNLNRLANQIARAVLAERGRGPEPVALLVGNGVPIVAAMLGVLKAGKFYVSLDASQPVMRTAAILEECRPALLIATSEWMGQAEALCMGTALDPAGVPLLNLDALEPGLSEENPGLATITSSSLAYLLYTSGSTGKPKGVMQDHRYVLHLTMAYTNSGQISAVDRLALLYSPSFAGAVRDIYCTLLNGATLFCFDVKREGLTCLADWLRHNRITVFFAVATMFRHFCRLLTPQDRFPSVRLVELGSETVYAGEVHLYQRHFSEESRMIVNLGGSEISPVCQFLVGPGTRIEGGTVPAGYAAEDVELLLWDTEGKPVAAGTSGEILVRSRYLSRGYWGHPELTAVTFLHDPEGGDRRLFRTGDLGRMLPDGCLLHMGRRDFQVKIRGYRVETAEVEALFAATGLVHDVAVSSWLDATGEQKLVAWLVPKHPDALPSINELRSLVAASLPEYMVPASFVIMDSLPLTESGKLDRSALPDPHQAALRSDTPYVAPRTAVEERLREIWSELLGMEKIGIHENFFALGGHSLLALQVVARIAAAFHVRLSPNSLFVCPTLALLADAVESARSIEADEAIQPAPQDAEIPLSFAQQRLWLFAEMEGPSETFNLARVFRLEGSLDTAALERTLAVISSRHNNLRTSFRYSDGNPVQAIAPEYKSVLSFVDLRHIPEDRRERELHTSLREADNRCFDLANGPLWSVRVIRLATNNHVLHLMIHHIISDDWSIQVLLRELSTIYSGCLKITKDPIPELPVQYADYAVWQRRWLSGERLTKQLGYWRDHLRGAPPLVKLPLDRPRQTGGEFHAGMVRLNIDREITMQLRRLSRESETTLFVTLLASFATLLSRYGNPAEVVIGTALANRYPVEIEALIGFFVSTLALRLQWRNGATFREIQACTHRTAVNGYAHPDVPFDQVVEALHPDRCALHSPLFQTLFVLQNVPKQEFVLPGLMITPIDRIRPSAGNTFDLTLSLKEVGEELSGALEFNDALFDTVTIERMAAHFQTLLARIVQEPDTAVVEMHY